MTRLLAGYLFVEPFHEDSPDADMVRSEDEYLPHRGRYIRHVQIVPLDVFQRSAADTLASGLAKLGNDLHVRTQEGVIADYLLFGPGDRLDPFALADTERLLRSTGFIHDARIDVMPVSAEADSVDIVILTRDRWSIGLRGSVSSTSRSRINPFERNLLGLGYEIDYELNVDQDRPQPTHHRARLAIDNIRGSFVAGEFEFRDTFEEQIRQISFLRSELAPQIQFTGGLLFGSTRTGAADDSSTGIHSTFKSQDLWIGWSPGLRSNMAGGPGRTHATVAGRFLRTNYNRRPPVTADENRSFHDRTMLLGSVSLSCSNFRKGRLIFGYGRTEDIPEGYIATLTSGYEFKEFDDRVYAGISVTEGRYRGRFGYLAVGARVGGFIRDAQLEDGALGLTGAHFTNPKSLGRYHLRLFESINYTQAIGRGSGDTIRLADSPDFPGLDDLLDSELNGQLRLSVGVEPVLFTPWRFYGFRSALFGFTSLGTISPDVESLTSQRFYPSVGLGIRIHNERLVFDVVELRVAALLSKPPDASTRSFIFRTMSETRVPSFIPGPPSVVEYQ